MLTVNFYDEKEIDEKLLKFAVITARFRGKWIFCRHKERDTLEIAGGHREINEDITDTARRELFEETGAVEFKINPICVYSVTNGGETTYGKLFFANVIKLGEIPKGMEIAEIILSDKLPEKLTYPSIQPLLFEKTQWWLNIQSSKDEIWDVYDENRNLTDRTHRRGDPLPKGDYHIIVHVWLKNIDGRFMITKRAPNKGYPNMWECTGGSAVSGDDSIAAAIREVKEETGLDVQPEFGKCLFNFKREDNFCDVWVFTQHLDISKVVLQENETTDVKYATKDEILTMTKNGEFVKFDYLNKLFEMI